ncbi:MAG: J domain-containing protein, partial [Aquincola tertiaricarbonis]
MSTETAALEELGLRPGASEAEIKAAWRKLVSRWHPDRNASRAAVEKMQRINQAFELLRGAGAAAAPVRPAEPAAPAA